MAMPKTDCDLFTQAAEWNVIGLTTSEVFPLRRKSWRFNLSQLVLGMREKDLVHVKIAMGSIGGKQPGLCHP